MRTFLIPLLFIITGCAPSSVQSVFVTTASDGTRTYHFTGYTGTGETKPDDGRKYLAEALSKQCNGPAHVIQLYESPAHNGFGEFLAWDGEGQCDKK